MGNDNKSKLDLDDDRDGMSISLENEADILDGAIDDAIERQCIECLSCSEYITCVMDKSVGCVQLDD